MSPPSNKKKPATTQTGLPGAKKRRELAGMQNSLALSTEVRPGRRHAGRNSRKQTGVMPGESIVLGCYATITSVPRWQYDSAGITSTGVITAGA